MTVVTDCIRPCDLVVSPKFDRLSIVQWMPVVATGAGVHSRFAHVDIGEAFHVFRVPGITDDERADVLSRIAARTIEPGCWMYRRVLSPGNLEAMVDAVRDCFRTRSCFDGCTTPMDVVGLVHSDQLHVIKFSLLHMLYSQA